MTKQHFPALRIGLCLAGLTVTIILVADQFFGIVPDQRQQLAETRKVLCESIAVQLSSLIDDEDKTAMQSTMGELVNRNPDLLSLGLRLEEGGLLASTVNHDSDWNIENTEQSTLDQVRVPLYKSNQPWGTVEVKFTPQYKAYWQMVTQSPLTKLILVTLTFGLLAYTYFIGRTLRIMDPGAVVPQRVKAALDQLVEGVVLLDEQMNIVLANDAFLSMTDKSLEKLAGKSLSTLSWRTNSTQVKVKMALPWEQLAGAGGRVQGSRLLYKKQDGAHRVLSCNVSAINDGKGNQRGAIASFDDISDIELTNAKLQTSIEQLEEAETKIRSQNNELRQIASIDPLTGIMNRGAFFEKLHTEFMLAKQEGLKLSCIMADIDHFKRINDTYGHGVGDDVIKGMAKVLSKNKTTNGTVGRYGGEEFCIILPGLTVEEAVEVGEKMRLAFAAWSEAQTGATEGRLITASVGVSALNLGAGDHSELINQADSALYTSKTNGRNRVSRWYPETSMSVVG